MAIHSKKTKISGFGFIEIIVATFVVVVGFLAISYLFANSLRVQNGERLKIRAATYLEEGMESVKAIRSEGWANIPESGTHYLDMNAIPWALVSLDPGPLDGIYTRRIIFSRAYRDIDGNLALAGTEDPSARKVRVEVEWQFGGTSKAVFIEGYITKW